jgi:hypothetical protein
MCVLLQLRQFEASPSEPLDIQGVRGKNQLELAHKSTCATFKRHLKAIKNNWLVGCRIYAVTVFVTTNN